MRFVEELSMVYSLWFIVKCKDIWKQKKLR